MLTFTPTPTGGIGQPLHPARPSRRPACANDHADPERAGDCPCADLAAEAAERASGDCAWDTAAECHQAQADYLAEHGEVWSRCRRHPIASYRLAQRPERRAA
jgi:hypothetical protein